MPVFSFGGEAPGGNIFELASPMRLRSQCSSEKSVNGPIGGAMTIRSRDQNVEHATIFLEILEIRARVSRPGRDIIALRTASPGAVAAMEVPY